MADRKQGEGEEPQGIKVTDRRNFTREGERREPDAPPEAPATAMADNAGTHAQAARGASEPTGASGGARKSAPTREAAPASPAATAPDAEPPPSIDFVAFIHSLYMSALMALGEVENPYTHQFEANLDLARENVDILLMLQDKTRGNLTPEEHGYLSQALPQLQMLYVRKARGG